MNYLDLKCCIKPTLFQLNVSKGSKNYQRTCFPRSSTSFFFVKEIVLNIWASLYQLETEQPSKSFNSMRNIHSLTILWHMLFIILLKGKNCIWVLSQNKIFHNCSYFHIIHNPCSNISSFLKHCKKFLPSYSNLYLCWKIKYFGSLMFLRNCCINTVFPQWCHQDVSHEKRKLWFPVIQNC